MTLHIGQSMNPALPLSAPNFRAWQKHVFALGLLPVISVAGDSGKSTVIRLLDFMFRTAGLRTATWTDLGVEIRGRKQRGEISGWSQALGRLSEASIDVAIQELHWSMINTVGLPAAAYPVIGITNLFSHHEGPLLSSQETGWRGAVRAVAAVHQQGALVINGDDYALIDASAGSSCDLAVTSLSSESPGLRRHLTSGGTGLWADHGNILAGSGDQVVRMLEVGDVPFTRQGAATFLTSSVLMAASIASTIGIDVGTMGVALREFRITDDILPGSFNIHSIDGYRVVIDRRPSPAHMRHLQRTINPGGKRRQISVLGDVNAYSATDAHELGRLLGRCPGAVILHSSVPGEQLDQLRKGIAANDYPPLFVLLPTERRAINRALKTARPEDVVLLLTGEDPSAVIRAVHRQANA